MANMNSSGFNYAGGNTPTLSAELPGSIHYGLRGPAGPKGEPFKYEDFTQEQLEALKVKGDKGDPGIPGIPGADGKDGYTPVKGVDYFDGNDGKDGVDGKSAYQYALDGGYTGTEEEFTQKLAAGGGDSVLDSDGKLKNSVLPDGYPYKEYEFEPITWDGNTDGRLLVAINDKNYYKVAELPIEGYFPEDSWAIPVVIGNEIHYCEGLVALSGSMSNGYFIIIGNSDLRIAIALKDNVTGSNGSVFPEAGIYFQKSGTDFVSWLAGMETIRPMAAEFAPAKRKYSFYLDYGDFYHYFENDMSVTDFYNLVFDIATGEAICSFNIFSRNFDASMSCNNAVRPGGEDGEEVHLHFIDDHNNIKHTVILTAMWDDDDNFGVDVSYTDGAIEPTVFDLFNLGMSAITLPTGYATVSTDTTALQSALSEGSVIFVLPVDMGGTTIPVRTIMQGIALGTSYQCTSLFVLDDTSALVVNVDPGSITVMVMPASTAVGLPAITAADNGYVMEVVNGKWEKVAVKDSSVATFVDDYISSALEGDY